ncbi:hypothetical protein GEMRC1_000151 [Eukaryota sp. GEM-RC1]
MSRSLFSGYFFLSGFATAACGISIVQIFHVALVVDAFPSSSIPKSRSQYWTVLAHCFGYLITQSAFEEDVDFTRFNILFLLVTIISCISTLCACKETPFKRKIDTPFKLCSVLDDLEFSASENWNFVIFGYIQLLFFTTFAIHSYVFFFMRDIFNSTLENLPMIICIAFDPRASLRDLLLLNYHGKSLYHICILLRIISLVALIFGTEGYVILGFYIFFASSYLFFVQFYDTVPLYLPPKKQAGTYGALLAFPAVIGLALGCITYGVILSFFPDGEPEPGMPQQYTRDGYSVCWMVSICILVLSSLITCRLRAATSEIKEMYNSV